MGLGSQTAVPDRLKKERRRVLVQRNSQHVRATQICKDASVCPASLVLAPTPSLTAVDAMCTGCEAFG
jgi:hypothetical protein